MSHVTCVILLPCRVLAVRGCSPVHTVSPFATTVIQTMLTFWTISRFKNFDLDLFELHITKVYIVPMRKYGGILNTLQKEAK
jgi:hypothetical protein